MFLPKLLAFISMLNNKEVRIGITRNKGKENKIVDMSDTCGTRIRAERISLNPERASLDVISHAGYGVTQPQRGRCALELEVNLSNFRMLSTGRLDRMSHRKWRQTKQQLSRARSVHQISCCLVYLHFLCDILSWLSSGPVMLIYFFRWAPASGPLFSALHSM